MPDVSFTELAGQRIALRRFRLEDAAEFVAYRSSVEVARYQGWDAPYSREQGERFVRQMMERHPDTAGEWFQFAVVLRETGQLVGDCAAMPHANDPSQCEIGFTIAGQHQGHGYATEMVRLLVGYLFTARDKHRVTACCDARNAASAAVLERLAMRREGHLRESTWAKGEWTDDLLYALLQDEWLARLHGDRTPAGCSRVGSLTRCSPARSSGHFPTSRAFLRPQAGVLGLVVMMQEVHHPAGVAGAFTQRTALPALRAATAGRRCSRHQGLRVPAG